MNYRISGRVTLGGSPQDSLWRKLKGKEQESVVNGDCLAAAMDLFRDRPSNTDEYYSLNKGSKSYTSSQLRNLSWVKYCNEIAIKNF